MIKVEVKYRIKPIKVNRKTGEMYEYVKNYVIRSDEGIGNRTGAIQKEVAKIFKEYQGVFSIRFCLEG